ncbi:hypothetical protein DMA11_17135 [Marinilabiliaceae bacterium JC017]|nr:hypothetical protein DMA11_17135 [Marinilabiliaceae bacterium JC017]
MVLTRISLDELDISAGRKRKVELKAGEIIRIFAYIQIADFELLPNNVIPCVRLPLMFPGDHHVYCVENHNVKMPFENRFE